MNKHKVKHHRNSDTKTANRDHIRTTTLERSVKNYWGLTYITPVLCGVIAKDQDACQTNGTESQLRTISHTGIIQ